MKSIINYLILLLSTISATLLTGQIKALTVEPNHSTVGFEIGIAGFTLVSGKFKEYTIDVDWDEKDLSNCSIKASINVKSIDTGILERDDHLRSADFFESSTYPTIEFVSEQVSRLEEGYVAHGTLSMHGITKEIKLPFTITKSDGNTIGFSSRTSIDRIDYGVGSEFKHTSMPDFLSDDIDVRIDFWTKNRKAKK